MPLPSEILETIAEERRENETLNRFNNVDDLAKSYIEQRSLDGQSMRIPGPDAGQDDINAFNESLLNKVSYLMHKPDFSNPEQSNEFYRSLGKPEEISGYTLPEGIQLPAEVVTEVNQMAFDNNLTDAQTQGIMKHMASMSDQTVENNQNTRIEDMEELAGKWGVTLDARMAAAKKMNDEFYPGRDFDSLGSGELQALHNIHTSVTGKGAQAPGQPGTPAGMTPQEAEDQAAEIMRRIHDPKSDLNHSEKMALQMKRIKMLETYVPKFMNEAA
jgi:hypothetical protein